MIGKEGKIIEISILIFYESGLNILWETLFYYRTPCVGVQSVAKSTKTIPRYDSCTSVRGVRHSLVQFWEHQQLHHNQSSRMGVKYCSVNNCPSNSVRMSLVFFTVRPEWQELCRWKKARGRHICQLHFKMADMKGRRLRRGALPLGARDKVSGDSLALWLVLYRIVYKYWIFTHYITHDSK